VAHFAQRRIRSIIFAVWQAASDEADSFWNALLACHAGKWQRNQNGFVLQGSSGSGFSQSFHVPMSNADPSNINDANLQDTFYLIIEKYQQVAACGLSENGATSDAFLKALLDQFPTITGYVPDFMFAQT
jgi:hypothetical protein